MRPKKKQGKKPRRPDPAAGHRRPTARVDAPIAAAARDNVLEILGQGQNPDRALEIAVSAFFLAEHLIRLCETENALPHPIVCGAGCDFCCFNQVELTPPEALLLGHAVTRKFPPAARDLVQANLARTLALTAGKTKAAIGAIRRQLPCPLLMDRQCSVYQIRPLVCRAMHALDRERCEAELHTGSLAPSPYYAHRQEIAVSVSVGLRDGCQVLGLQSQALGLAQALHDCLAQENPVERWLAGENVFEP